MGQGEGKTEECCDGVCGRNAGEGGAYGDGSRECCAGGDLVGGGGERGAKGESLGGWVEGRVWTGGGIVGKVGIEGRCGDTWDGVMAF